MSADPYTPERRGREAVIIKEIAEIAQVDKCPECGNRFIKDG